MRRSSLASALVFVLVLASIMQTTLHSGTTYYIMLGTSDAKRADEFTDPFRRMAASFKRR